MNIHYSNYCKLREGNRIRNTFQTLARFVVDLPVYSMEGLKFWNFLWEAVKCRYAETHTWRKQSKVSIPRYAQWWCLNGGRGL